MVEQSPVEGLRVEDAVTRVLGSTAAYVVLGLVIEKPSHGYEIRKRLDALEERVGPLLSMSASAVYATLGSLQRAGLIEKLPGRSATEAPRGARAGASYRATPLGARAYRERLALQVRDDPQRLEMLGQMTLAGVRSLSDLSEFLDRYEQQCFVEAGELAPASERSSELERDALESLMARLLVAERRSVITARLDWVAVARAEIRGMGTRWRGV